MRSDFLSDMAVKDDRQRRLSIPKDYPESMAGSVSTLSSHPVSPATSNKSPVFDPAVYVLDHDQIPDSVDIMSHSRQTSVDSQYRDLKNRTINAKVSLPKLSSGRPQSLNLPLRTGKNSPTEEKTHKILKRSTAYIDRASSVNPGRARFDARAFDLMDPPPGRRRSGLTETTSMMNLKPHGGVDADPSEALASRIAASILREGFGVRAAKSTVPLKVQDAVGRCLKEVSTTVEDEHPQWALPTYYSEKVRSWTSSDYDGLSGDAGLSSRKRAAGKGGDGDDDPFRYDQSQRQGSEPYELKPTKKVKGLYGSPAYPCPFRRRNPVLFNIRDQENCAKRPFSDIPELKRHIRTCHRKSRSPYHCPRCKRGFLSESDMAEHLMVPAEQICEANSASSNSSEEDGITEEMDRALADDTRRENVQTWEEIWKLLFPQDAAVLDPEFQPAVEMVEMEQELDDSQAELKADLSESLKRLLPDQPEDVCFFLAGQFQLVFEQHRAKVNRRCHQNAGSSKNRTSTIERNKVNPSRFSIRNVGGTTSKNYTAQGTNQQTSPNSHRQRQSQAQPMALRTNTTPATSSSVYSTNSNVSLFSNSKPPTRSSTLSTVGIQIESPRLPFRDWVQGIKFNNSNGNNQRDSGLAMDQCEVCKMDPCQCEGYTGYADQLSAFMTPAPVQAGLLPPYDMASQGNDGSDMDWAAHYGAKLLSARLPSPSSAPQAEGIRT
ncbi:hypothetical protein VM1G_05066 [Cytospora mali]|uniref:C2H2-type domain-containing protein n=1 Tax=Cytospora mali TaxID=578113 RepID=A0A194VYM3_CYTMA|nr:hypothetical protein VM1G_05066 [Valsa mali]